MWKIHCRDKKKQNQKTMRLKLMYCSLRLFGFVSFFFLTTIHYDRHIEFFILLISIITYLFKKSISEKLKKKRSYRMKKVEKYAVV